MRLSACWVSESSITKPISILARASPKAASIVFIAPFLFW